MSRFDIMFENVWKNEEFKDMIKNELEEQAEIPKQLKEMEERGDYDL